MEIDLTGDGVRLAATVTGDGGAGTAVLDRILLGIPMAPVVIGASIVGIAVLLAAGRHDPGIPAVVLVDVATRHEQGGIERIRSFMTSHPGGFASLEDVAQALATYDPERGPIDDVERLCKNLRQLPDGRFAWHWDPTFMWPYCRDGRTDVTRPVTDRAQLRAAARPVRIPTLLVRCRRSDLVTEAGAKELLGLIPHARYVDGAGHMVVGHDNDRFGSAVTEFVGELETA